MIFKGAIQTIKDYIFPIACLDCGREGEWLCGDCYKKLDLAGQFFCPVCHKTSELGRNCFNCQPSSYLQSQIAILPYQEESLIGKIIHSLKYYYAEDLRFLIERIIADFVKERASLFAGIDQIIPVPLHKKRLAERGFNQAQAVAEIIAGRINKPICLGLDRTKATSQQAKLKREERLKNVKDAFVSRQNIQGNILIVDDVFTTGSTMQECAKVLKECGVREVVGFSVARG